MHISKYFISLTLVSIVFFLTGCNDQDLKPFSPEYKITVVSSDAYDIYKSSVASSWSESVAINGASQQAQEYCNDIGKQTVVRSISQGMVSMMTFESKYFFSCIEYSDNSVAAQMARSQHNSVVDGLRYDATLEANRIAERLKQDEIDAINKQTTAIRNQALYGSSRITNMNCNVGYFGTIQCTSY